MLNIFSRSDVTSRESGLREPMGDEGEYGCAGKLTVVSGDIVCSSAGDGARFAIS